MTYDRLEWLANDLMKLKGSYNGWNFRFMYPGVFAYLKGEVVVFFTPDYFVPRTVEFHVTDSDDRYNQKLTEKFKSVSYNVDLTGRRLFDIVQPVLDDIDHG